VIFFLKKKNPIYSFSIYIYIYIYIHIYEFYVFYFYFLKSHILDFNYGFLSEVLLHIFKDLFTTNKYENVERGKKK
jgi:hypothetical protein